jgi:hypothetical protein
MRRRPMSAHVRHAAPELSVTARRSFRFGGTYAPTRYMFSPALHPDRRRGLRPPFLVAAGASRRRPRLTGAWFTQMLNGWGRYCQLGQALSLHANSPESHTTASSLQDHVAPFWRASRARSSNRSAARSPICSGVRADTHGSGHWCMRPVCTTATRSLSGADLGSRMVDRHANHDIPRTRS